MERTRVWLSSGSEASHRPIPSTLAWLLVTAALVQIVMVRPPFPSDSMAYFGWAENLLSNEPGHGTTRLGVLIPVRFAIGLFGPSEAAYYAIPLIMALGLVAATYVVGTQLAGSNVGLIASMTMASSVLVLNLSSQIVPDPFATTWFVVGVSCLLTAPLSKHRTRWITLGALSIGAAYLSREYAMFMAPLVVYIGWISRWRRKEWIQMAAILGGVFLIEMLLMAFVFDDPFVRLKALAGFADTAASGERALLNAYGEGADRVTVLTRAPLAFMGFNVGTLLVLSVPLGIAFLFIDRQRRWLWSLLLVWVASLWIPMMLLAGILDPESPTIRDNHIRYWYLIIPALYLLLGAVLVSTARFVRKETFRLVVIGALALVVVGSSVSDVADVTDRERFRGLGATQWDEVRNWLRTDGPEVDRIYTDRRMARVLPLYSREIFGEPIWEGEIIVFEQGGEFIPVAELDGALVLHRLGLRYLRNRDLRVPDDYLDPGPSWETKARRADGSLTIFVKDVP